MVKLEKKTIFVSLLKYIVCAFCFNEEFSFWFKSLKFSSFSFDIVLQL